MKSVIASLALIVAIGAPAVAQDGQQKPPQKPQNQAAPAGSREARIAELIKKLGDPQFDVREAAQRELEAIGAPAAKALDEATRSADPEVASRATEALARIREGRGQRPSDEPPQDLSEEPPLRDPRLPPEMPDMREMMKELQEQMKDLQQTLPPEFSEMFKDLFQGRLPGQPGEEEQGAEPRPGQPRVRVWTWNNQQPLPQRRRGSPFEQGLGLELGPATPALRAQLGIAGDEGVVVNQLDPEGRAAKAGLQTFDVIVGVDGRSVRSPRDLAPLLQAGGKVELYRRAKLETVEVPAPGPAPAPAPTPAPAPGGSGERSF